MFCPNCGHKNPDENRYCGMCGTSLLELAGSRRASTKTSAVMPAPFREPSPLLGRNEKVTPVSEAREVKTATAAAAGQSAQQSKPPITAASIEPVRGEDSRIPISGPSFLGLGGPSEDFLEELEEPPRRRGVAVFFGLAIIMFVGLLIALQWRDWSEWKAMGSQWIADMTASSSEPATVQTGIPKPDEAADASPDETQEQLQADVGDNNPTAEQKQAASSQPPAPPSSAESKTSPRAEKSASKNEPIAAGAKESRGSESPAEESEITKERATAEDAEIREPVSAPGQYELDQAQRTSGMVRASWLWKAIKKQNPEAPVLLADMYVEGDGIAQDCDQALVLLQSAARKRNAQARGRLGALYEAGQCVPQDRLAAYAWLTAARSADPYDESIERARDVLWARMTPEERQRASRSSPESAADRD